VRDAVPFYQTPVLLNDKLAVPTNATCGCAFEVVKALSAGSATAIQTTLLVSAGRDTDALPGFTDLLTAGALATSCTAAVTAALQTFTGRHTDALSVLAHVLRTGAITASARAPIVATLHAFTKRHAGTLPPVADFLRPETIAATASAPVVATHRLAAIGHAIVTDGPRAAVLTLVEDSPLAPTTVEPADIAATTPFGKLRLAEAGSRDALLAVLALATIIITAVAPALLVVTRGDALALASVAYVLLTGALAAATATVVIATLVLCTEQRRIAAVALIADRARTTGKIVDDR